MRPELIKSLYYPMSLIYGSIDLSDCPHTGRFDPTDGRCERCEFGAECEWANKNDAFSSVNQKTEQELIETLEFARDYVSVFTSLANHNVKACMCEACSWLRETRNLLRETTDSAPRS